MAFDALVVVPSPIRYTVHHHHGVVVRHTVKKLKCDHVTRTRTEIV